MVAYHRRWADSLISASSARPRRSSVPRCLGPRDPPIGRVVGQGIRSLPLLQPGCGYHRSTQVSWVTDCLLRWRAIRSGAWPTSAGPVADGGGATGLAASRGAAASARRSRGGVRHAWSEVVSAPADRMAGHPEQGQDQAHHHDDDADRPDDGNVSEKPDNEENNAKNNQRELLTAGGRPSGRKKSSASNQIELQLLRTWRYAVLAFLSRSGPEPGA
jgi:hypothetical protein